MRNKSILAVIFAMLAITLLAVPALADQDGGTCWCNIDKDGCWNTNEDGGKDYIMFWTEAARKYYMGDSTAPYTNVVDRADGARLKMLCGAPSASIVVISQGATIESVCTEFVGLVMEYNRKEFEETYGTRENALNDCIGHFSSVSDAEAGLQEYKDYLKNPQVADVS